MSNGSERPRIRAWFYLQVEDVNDAKSIAKKIYKQYKDEPTDDLDQYVIIRASVIRASENSGLERFKIVVPVDAIVLEEKPDDEEFVLDEVEGYFRAVKGVIDVARVIVVENVPEPPHFTQGYISDPEFKQGKEIGITDVTHAGRQYPKSPGSNKWG
jgi:hypothetical protein